MPNIHTPERQPNEPIENYKQRRGESKAAIRAQTNPPKEWGITLHFLTPSIKNTKHTRAGSTKRKGAL